ncbi:hypothetical protein KY340_04590, partial [Candidatus Woesearchaeota archaeon]|nr:hypothetical protein [Candidatus Woesearchaeota archaeon]
MSSDFLPGMENARIVRPRKGSVHSHDDLKEFRGEDLWMAMREAHDPVYHKQIDAAFMYCYDGDVEAVKNFVVVKKYLPKESLDALADEVEEIRKLSMIHGGPREKTISIEDALREEDRKKRWRRFKKIEKQQAAELGQHFAKGPKSTHIGQMRRTAEILGYNFLPIIEQMRPIRVYDQRLIDRMNSRLRKEGIEVEESPRTVPDSCQICSQKVNNSVTLQEFLEDGSPGSGNLFLGKGCAITLYWLFNVKEHQRKIRDVQRKVKKFREGKDEGWNRYVMIKDEKELENIVSEKVIADIEQEKLRLEEQYKRKLLAYLKEARELFAAQPDARKIMWAMQISGGYLGFFKDRIDDLEPEELRIYKKMVMGRQMEDWERAIMYTRFANENFYSKSKIAGGIIDDVIYFIENDMVSADAFGSASRAALLADLAGSKERPITIRELQRLLKSTKDFFKKREEAHAIINTNYDSALTGNPLEQIVDLLLEYDADIKKDIEDRIFSNADSKIIRPHHEKYMTAQAAIEKDPEEKRKRVIENIHSVDSIREYDFMLKELFAVSRKIKLHRYFTEFGSFKDRELECLLLEDCADELADITGIEEFRSRNLITVIQLLTSAYFPENLKTYADNAMQMLPQEGKTPGLATYLSFGLVPKQLLKKKKDKDDVFSAGLLRQAYKLMKKKGFKARCELSDHLDNLSTVESYSKYEWIISMPEIDAFRKDIGRYSAFRKEDLEKISLSAEILRNLAVSGSEDKTNEHFRILSELHGAKMLSCDSNSLSDMRASQYQVLSSCKRFIDEKGKITRYQRNSTVSYYDPDELGKVVQELDNEFVVFENDRGRIREKSIQEDEDWLKKFDRITDDFWMKELKIYDNYGIIRNYRTWREHNQGHKLIVSKKLKSLVEKLYEETKQKQAVKRYHDKRRRFIQKQIPNFAKFIDSEEASEFYDLFMGAQAKAQEERARDQGRDVRYTRFYHLWRPPREDAIIYQAMRDWRNNRSFGKVETGIVKKFLKKGIENSYTMQRLYAEDWKISQFVRGRRWFGVQRSSERSRLRIGVGSSKSLPLDERIVSDFMHRVRIDLRHLGLSDDILYILLKASDWKNESARSMMQRVISGKRQRF